MFQATKKKLTILTDHGKQLLQRALISNVIVLYDTERIMGNDRQGRGGKGWGKI